MAPPASAQFHTANLYCSKQLLSSAAVGAGLLAAFAAAAGGGLGLGGGYTPCSLTLSMMWLTLEKYCAGNRQAAGAHMERVYVRGVRCSPVARIRSPPVSCRGRVSGRVETDSAARETPRAAHLGTTQ